jgi:HEAT repeat protein
MDIDPIALVAAPHRFLNDRDPAVRRLAVSGVAGYMEQATVRAAVRDRLQHDGDPAVRAEAAEVLAAAGPEVLPDLRAAIADPDPTVREAAATGIGEIGGSRATAAVEAIARDPDEDRLVIEAAVAALGALGDPNSLPLLLQLAGSGPPQIRRRAIVALTAFEGPEVETAFDAAREDRNPMVREVAEMILGRTISDLPGCGPITKLLTDPGEPTDRS